jgi:hypothetical protein
VCDDTPSEISRQLGRRRYTHLDKLARHCGTPSELIAEAKRISPNLR